MADLRPELEEIEQHLVRRSTSESPRDVSKSPNEKFRLPDSWTWARIGQLAVAVDYGSSAKCSAIPGGIPVLRMGNLRWGSIDTADLKYLPESHEEFPGLLLQDGDLLFNRTNSAELVGKTAVFRGQLKKASFASYLIRVRFDGVIPELVAAYLNSAFGRRWIGSVVSQQVGQANVNGSKLKACAIPLPPLSEQRRIVSRIDELFSRIEAGERAIATARAGLTRYRKSTLKAAVTGALTADWRGERGRSRRAGEHRTSDLPGLPHDWAWATIDQLTTHITSGSRDWKPFYDRGTSVFIMAQNVRPGRLDLSTVQNVDPPEGDRDAKRSEVRLDDLLVTIVGANTGDVCRVPKELERHYVCQSVALLRFADPCLARYVELFLQDAGPGRDQIKKFIYGAGRPHLSFEQLRSIAVAIPPEDERTEIVSRVEAALSRIRHADGTLDAQTRNARALKQSILKAAFEGRLVPQDPDDEPAADMLARIADERSAPKAKTKARA